MRYQIIRLLAFVILGMIAGSVLVTVNVGGQVDELTHENKLLNQQLELCRDELIQEKKRLGEGEKRVVIGIEPHTTIIEEDMADLEKKNITLALNKQVGQLLSPVKGQELKKLNHLLVPQIIDNRSVEFEGSKYQLNVKLMVIDTNIIVYVEAKKEKTIHPVNQPIIENNP
ncbi:MAG: hypothetical protein PHO01_06395 [Desulfotomaculaceae bacterium]|nr:hypothetical protein [Desulfotomaculaceae bacterium]